MACRFITALTSDSEASCPPISPCCARSATAASTTGFLLRPRLDLLAPRIVRAAVEGFALVRALRGDTPYHFHAAARTNGDGFRRNSGIRFERSSGLLHRP